MATKLLIMWKSEFITPLKKLLLEFSSFKSQLCSFPKIRNLLNDKEKYWSPDCNRWYRWLHNFYLPNERILPLDRLRVSFYFYRVRKLHFSSFFHQFLEPWNHYSVENISGKLALCHPYMHLVFFSTSACSMQVLGFILQIICFSSIINDRIGSHSYILQSFQKHSLWIVSKDCDSHWCHNFSSFRYFKKWVPLNLVQLFLALLDEKKIFMKNHTQNEYCYMYYPETGRKGPSLELNFIIVRHNSRCNILEYWTALLERWRRKGMKNEFWWNIYNSFLISLETITCSNIVDGVLFH